jgi:hypothetical protein
MKRVTAEVTGHCGDCLVARDPIQHKAPRPSQLEVVKIWLSTVGTRISYHTVPHASLVDRLAIENVLVRGF